jgi:hypothetical protein
MEGNGHGLFQDMILVFAWMTEVCVLFLFGGADELLYKRLFVE